MSNETCLVYRWLRSHSSVLSQSIKSHTEEVGLPGCENTDFIEPEKFLQESNHKQHPSQTGNTFNSETV